MIKGSKHTSYIWTAIASFLEKEGAKGAEREEIETQRKWRDGRYGDKPSGERYINWVKDSIRIHKKYGLTEEGFYEVINSATYTEGTEDFFKMLDRNRYIPVLISGGIQNLNFKACHDLNIARENSFAACEYFFTSEGKIDESLTFINSSNFCGKEELVKVLLRRYHLAASDWVFIGDGVNDVSIAKAAPLSIGIRSGGRALERIVDYAFDNFSQLIECRELIEREGLVK